MSILKSLSTRNELEKLYKEKKVPYIEKSVKNEEMSIFINDGWYCVKEFKHKKKMRKEKSKLDLFLDKIWCLFYKVGFDYISTEKEYRMPNSMVEDEYFDLVVADQETVLFIKCLYSDNAITGVSFKHYIDKFQEMISNNHSHFLKDKDNRNMKKCFVLAVENIVFTNTDMDRLKDLNIICFDNILYNYYESLVSNLGTSSKYQLLGYMFEGKKIPNLENEIPAIQGKMGNHTYYSFSIEPEKLLKISYVLHKDKANKDSIPAYQRLIKKTRLKEISSFVNSGGYFPNSVIININTNGRGLRFDQSKSQVKNSLSRIGILHIPQKYRSAYIIDGQHRLYGYAESKFKNTNTIPVVAFEDLSRGEQLKLFMDINEKQKAVSKGLRITLNADLLWDSNSEKERRECIKSVIAQRLGDDHDSPLYNRIIFDENETKTKCITLDTIVNSLSRSDFLSTYKKNNVLIKKGLLDYEDNEKTMKNIMFLLIQCLNYVRSKNYNDWNSGENGIGILTTNNGMFAFIKIINDIIIHLSEKECFDMNDLKKICSDCERFLDALIDKINTLTIEEKEEIKKRYGSGGNSNAWHLFEKYINESIPEFHPAGLDKYIIDNAKQYNEESFQMIRDIETSIKKDVKKKLIKKYGDKWFSYVPKNVYSDANRLASDKDYDNKLETGSTDPWDCLNFIHYRDIVMQTGDWAELFEKDYSYIEEGKKGGNKKDKTNWMKKVSDIRNSNVHAYSVKKEEFEYLKKIYEWFIAKNLGNESND